MAHPSSFALQESLMFGPIKDGEEKPLETFGAVNVGNPRNFYSLLQSGQTVLLYPGGMSEAFDSKVDEYNLLWPDKTDFVRAAAKFDAIIVPFAGVGCSDIGSIYGYELGNSSGSSQAPSSLLQAAFGAEEAIKRFGTPGLNDERLSFSKLPPLVIPNPPWETPRFYYRFGAPIDTRDLRPSNKDECKTTYNQVRGAVEGCISYLLEKRKQDPYAEQRKRFVYETLNARQAPSFDP